MPLNIAYYITPHGFGHAIRSFQVIRCLKDRAPSSRIVLVSDLPSFLIEQNVGGLVEVRKKRLDVGLVQADSIRFDLGATLGALQDLFDRHNALVSEERNFLKKFGAAVIVIDIPFLPLYAGSDLGIPSVAIGNFSWDWIYAAYAAEDSRWNGIIQWIREGYRRCSLFLQLPMNGECSVFPSVRKVPLIARSASMPREETRRILGCDPDKRAYLISFAHLELDALALRNIEAIEPVLFFYKRPIHLNLQNGRSLDEFTSLGYADAVAAMDGVITKPGYGIVSDCLVNGIPMIYTDRGFFPEYDILVREMRRHLPVVYMPSRDLYAGRWAEAIAKVENLPRRTPEIIHDGAKVCAEIILEMASRR